MELGGSEGSPRTSLGGGAMKISSEKLAAEAEATGFRPDVLEKVAHLLGLLDALRSHPFLKGKLVLKGGNLEVDLNFMFRVPLWPVSIRDSHSVGAWRATEIPVLDPHELAAGKLVALLSRRQARDLFDGHRVLQMDGIDSNRLRTAFVVYGAMNRTDWRTVSADDLEFDARELARQLVPTLRLHSQDVPLESAEYGTRLVMECKEGLSGVLPLTASEQGFLDLLLDQGQIDASLLTAEPSLQRRIQSQPLLEWKALNVRRHKGLP